MFELYDSLASQPTEKVDVEKLRAEIAALDAEGHTYVFALVYYSHELAGTPPPTLNKRVTLDLNSLSKSLLNILLKFTRIHRQRMNEQREMTNAQRRVVV